MALVWWACPSCGGLRLAQDERRYRLRCRGCGEWVRQVGDEPRPPATEREQLRRLAQAAPVYTPPLRSP